MINHILGQSFTLLALPGFLDGREIMDTQGESGLVGSCALRQLGRSGNGVFRGSCLGPLFILSCLFLFFSLSLRVGLFFFHLLLHLSVSFSLFFD